MQDSSRPPLPKYAKYLPEYEPTALADQVKTTPSQPGSGLHIACIMLSFISGFTTAYLLASLVIVPYTPARPLIIFWAEVSWVPFGLLPGMGALICWCVFKARQSTQG